MIPSAAAVFRASPFRLNDAYGDTEDEAASGPATGISRPRLGTAVVVRGTCDIAIDSSNTQHL
jgi:hypothetical protein